MHRSPADAADVGSARYVELMSEDFDPEPYELAMWADVATLADKRTKIEELQLELAAARDSLTESMRRYGAALSIDEAPIPHGVIRKLYWEHRDIHADSIARAFALPGGAGQVHRFAGENYYDLPCPAGCGKTVRLTSRSAPVRPCAACAAAREKRLAAQWEQHRETSARAHADYEARMRSEFKAGRTAEQIYAEHADRYEIGSQLPWLRELEAEVKGAEDAAPVS
jgi:hypothetical protein